MKKYLLIMLALFVLTFCVACGGTPEETEPSANQSTSSTEDSSNTTVDSSNTSDSTETPVKEYTIKWYDENGNLLDTDTVKEGSIPSYSYIKTDTTEWDYTFEGWSITEGGDVLNSIPTANENNSYYAVISKIKQKYTVTFNSNGGSAVSSQTVEYGQFAIMPEAPKFDGHRFVGWCIDENGNTPVDFSAPITGNIEFFAIWNEIVDVKALLSALLEGYKLNPYSYFPESMRIDFSNNLVDSDNIISDYTDFVDISDITYGYGEQYHMVIDNLQQSTVFFNALSVIETISASSISAFNNYFDKNPADTAHHTFENGIYNITVSFDGEVIHYVVEYTANLPVVGEQTVQLALSMIMETGEKTVRVQINDANALAYTITENSYTFAIRYLGVRRAMISLERDEDCNVTGHIYEYLTVMGAEVASCADIYITEDYVSVIGNKANGMIGFTGYISELYDVNTGKLLGYEVMETLSALTYNTLWFNLSDIDGINSIKFIPAADGESAKIYVNSSSTAWAVKKNLLTRRFDIEMRKQFVYSYNAETEEYTMHEISVPMIFIQEDNYDTFEADVKSANKNLTVSVDVSDDDLEKILEDYDELIPIFIENKNTITVDAILEFIGTRIIF